MGSHRMCRRVRWQGNWTGIVGMETGLVYIVHVPTCTVYICKYEHVQYRSICSIQRVNVQYSVNVHVCTFISVCVFFCISSP